MKKITLLLIFFLTLYSGYSQGNLDSLFQNDSEIVASYNDLNSSLGDLDQVFELKTELEAQKLLKIYFMVGFIFMSLVVFILLFFYNAKIKNIIKNIEKHEDDIIIKNFHIEKLSLILNSIFDMVALIDGKGNLLWANSNFFKIRNLKTEDEEKINLFKISEDLKQAIEKINKKTQIIEYKTQTGNKEIIRKIIPLIQSKEQKIESFAIIEKTI